MPINAIPLYLEEVDKQTRYREDCMYYQTIVNLKEEYRDKLLPPYINKLVAIKTPATTYNSRLDNAESLEEYLNIMFDKEGVN